jgi:protein SCO1/2
MALLPSRERLVFALTLLSVALLVAVSTLWFIAGDRKLPGTGTALVGGAFEMTDQDGRRVTDKDFLGKYMLVFFGYTYCPDVCPSELQVMSAALDELGSEADAIQPVFVSIDPGRDTPAVMKEYVSNFHPRLMGLTGSPEDVARIASAFRVFYASRKVADGPDSYLMDHSSILYLMGPDGKFLRHFSYGTDVKALAAALRDALGKQG